MRNYGIMQGRLTKPKGRGIQFFPFDNWKEEFFVAQEIGLQEIEYIFDYENYEQNPMWTSDGVQALQDVITETGVAINAVCFDYFMRRPFYKAIKEEMDVLREENKQIFLRVIGAMKALNVSLIEIPSVDNSSLQTENEKKLYQDFLVEMEKEVARICPQIKIGLETDLPPLDFVFLLNSINKKRIGANYDSGNSSGLGYDLYEEVATLSDKIFNIHIKDRIFQGTTVKLGTGSADFERLFQGLKEINYQGAFILQAARGEEGFEKENIISQLEFVKQYCKKYGL